MKIKIDGKEYGLTWGVSAITRYAEMVDMELEPALDIIFKKDDAFKQIIALSKFVSCAIDSYALVHGEETGQVPPTKILAEFDEQGPDFAKTILDDFMTSKLLGQTVAEFLDLVTSAIPEKTKKKSAQPK